MGVPAVISSIERYHRRHKRDKTLKLRRRCSSPACVTGWEALVDSPYCLQCHVRIEDHADALRAHNDRRNT